MRGVAVANSGTADTAGGAARTIWSFQTNAAPADIAHWRIFTLRTTFDFSPLFRTAVGYDRMTRALDSAQRIDKGELSYPPYDIEKRSDDEYRITMAIAGFTVDDVEIVEHGRVLTVKGKPKSMSNSDQQLLHRGIAGRAFERRFQLADYVEVAEANLQNGLLQLHLKRNVPEEMKPRRVSIQAVSADAISDKAA